MILLQDAGQLEQAVDKISKSSLEITRATAEYGALRVAFGIFMILIIILVILFIIQVFSLNKKIHLISEVVTETKEYLGDISEASIGETQAQVIIRRIFNYLSYGIKFNVLKIRMNNHIDQKDRVHNKVKMMVNNEIIDIRNYLSNFIYKNKPLSVILDEDDAQVLTDFVIEQVYIEKSEWNIAQMEQTIDLFIQGMKLQYIKKL